jgi:hypothetical protein
MTRSRTIAIAALAAGLLAGGGVGMTLGVPGIAGAQTVTDTPAVEVVMPADHTTRPTESARPGHGSKHGAKHGGKGLALETVAPLLGTTVDDVAEALRNGTSIAAQAEAAGVPLQTIVDALVADLGERLATKVESGRLTQEQADAKLAEAPERIAARLDQVRPAGGQLGHGGSGHH